MTPTPPSPLPARPRPSLVPAALVAAASATVLQIGWLERIKAHLAGARAAASSSTVRLDGLLEAARTTVGLDAVFALAGLVVAAWITVGAVRRAGDHPEGLAALVPRSAIGRLGLLLLATWTFVRWHASPGALDGFDLRLHAAHTTLVADALAAGRVPSWTDRWYLGFPLLRLYGITFYLPTAALALLLGDVRAAVKIATATWHLLAAPAAARLARTAGAPRGTALLAGLAYAACPYFVNTLAHLGSLTAAPVIALAPAALSAALRAGRGDGWRHAVRAGAVGALLVGAHPAYAAQVAVLCALAFVAAAVTRGPSLRSAVVAAGVAAVVAGLGALPVLAAWVDGVPSAGSTPGALGLVYPAAPNPDALRFLFRWTPRPEVTPTGYLGFAFAALALLGFVGPQRGGMRRPWLAALLAATVVGWCGPGYVRERALLLLPAVLLPLVAAGLATVARPRLVVLAVGLLLVDLGVGNLASPYRADLEPLARDLATLASAPGDGRTVLVAVDDAGRASAGEWQVAAEVPLATLLGGFREAAPGTHAPMRAVVDAVAEDRDVHDDALRRLLASLHVTTVATIAHRRVTSSVRLAPEPRVRFAPERVTTDDERAPSPDQVVAWWAACVPPAGSAPTAMARVVVPAAAGTATVPLPAVDDGGPLSGATVAADWRVDARRSVVVSTPSAGFLRLDEAWTRDLVTTVDGGVVRAERDVFGLVVVPVAGAGEHAIVLDRPHRYGWAPASAGALLALLATLIPVRRPRRGPPDAAPATGASADAHTAAR